MQKIGLVSDTHGFIDDKLLSFFAECDEIWHAGDIGNIKVAELLGKQKALRAVFGNIDGADVRSTFPEINQFKCEKMNIWIVHIGGYPGNYTRTVKELLANSKPNVLITGHSHILKVIYDKKNGFLHINPGAYGKLGSHAVRTAVRFTIDNDEMKDLEVLELPR
jgi:hypothetical protein